MRPLLYNICSTIFLLATYPAAAADALTPVNFRGQYSFALAGLEFGRMGLHVTENGTQYEMAADIKTTGLLAVFVKHSSHTTLSGNKASFTYESNYHTRKKKRYVKMLGKNGIITEETLVPADSPDKRPPVPPEMKKDAFTPLAYVLEMRRRAYASTHGGPQNYSLKFYDGRRLTEGFYTLEKPENNVDVEGTNRPVATFSAYRKQLAGFTASELEDPKEKEPLLYIHYSRDERFIPLKLQVRLLLGSITATLEKECAPEESCLLGNSD